MWEMGDRQQVNEPPSDLALEETSVETTKFSEKVTAILLAQPLNPIKECRFSWLSNRQPEAGFPVIIP